MKLVDKIASHLRLTESPAMRVMALGRDHKDTFKSRELKSAEKFVGAGHWSKEIGIDDGYCLFYFSAGVPAEVSDWVINNRYTVWGTLLDGVTFGSFDELISIVNESLIADGFIEEGDEPLTRESSND